MRKLTEMFKAIIPIFVALLIMFGASIIITFAAAGVRTLIELLKPGKNGQQVGTVIRDSINVIVNNTQLSYTISFVAMLVCIIYFSKWYRRINTVSINNNQVKYSLSSTGVIVLLGIGCQVFVSATLTLIQPLLERLFVEYGETIDSIFSGNPIIVALYVVAVGPIGEELIFRGVMLSKLKSTVPFLWANIIQALVFGIYHMDVIQGIYAFCMGIILGFVCHRMNSLFASILLHIIINLCGYLLGVIGGVPTIAACVLMQVFGAGLVIATILRILKRTEIEGCVG